MEILLKNIEIYGNYMENMEIYGNSIENNGNLWKFDWNVIEIYRILCFLYKTNKIQSGQNIEIYGNSMENMEIYGNSMETHGNLWKSIEISTKFIEKHWNYIEIPLKF